MYTRSHRKGLLAVWAVTVFLLVGALALAQMQDLSKVTIKSAKVSGQVYMLEGAGGNIGASVGADGILIVDDQFAPLAEKIQGELKRISEGTPGQLKFVLNTHWHGDHTGGNATFGRQAMIVAHTNVRNRLTTEQKSMGQTRPPEPKEAWPVITFDQSLSIHFNGEEIKVMHYPSGHTDGDSVIFFTKSNVIHMGDHFFNGFYPFIDTSSGGSLSGYLKNVEAVLAMAPKDAKIIPGHGPLAAVEDLRTFHRTLTETVDLIRKQKQAGKTVEQAKKEGLPEKYKSWGSFFINTDRWIDQVWAGL